MPITFEHVSYNYNPTDAKKRGASIPQALDDVSLTIPDGQFLAIIGHTGSGKSTLVQHMNGLLQPTSGRVLVDGLDLAEKANRRAVRRYVGLTFQYPEYQLFANTVAEDVAFGPRNLGVDEDEVQRRGRSAPLSFPAGSSAGWRSQGFSPCTPKCWCSTSPWQGWTRRAGSKSCSTCTSSTTSWGSPS